MTLETLTETTVIVRFLQIRDRDNVIYVSVQIKEKQNAYFSDVFRIRIIELMNR